MIVHLTGSNVTCFLFVSFRKNCSRASKKTQVGRVHYDLESNLMGLLHGVHQDIQTR